MIYSDFPTSLPRSFPFLTQPALHFQCHTLIFALVSQPVAVFVPVCVRVGVCECVRVQVYASCFARFCSFITHLTHKSNMCKCFHFICTLIHIKYFRCPLCIAHEASTRNRGKSSSSNITRAEQSRALEQEELLLLIRACK